MKKRIVALMLGTLIALSTVGTTFAFASSALDIQQGIVNEQIQESTGSEQVGASVESNLEQEVESSGTDNVDSIGDSS